jgi:hypothetical protein
MAPEQVRGQPPRPATDLFGLGCILYEMLTGTRPFAGQDVLATLASLAADTPPAPQRLRAEVPPDLSRLVLQLLDKDPGKRPESAHGVVNLLSAGGEAAPARPAGRRRALAGLGVALLALASFTAYKILEIPATVDVLVDSAEVEALLRPTGLHLREQRSGREVILRPGWQALPAGTYSLAGAVADGELAV